MLKEKNVIFSVKGGGATSGHVRDLRGVIERQRATIGVFVRLGKPTKEMEKEAASAGFYVSPFGGTKYPRLQIITAAGIIDGKDVAMPPKLKETTHRIAPRAKPQESTKEKTLFGDVEVIQAEWEGP